MADGWLPEFYHGTPITPMRELAKLDGFNFCISHARPDCLTQIMRMQGKLMLDCGSYSTWKRGHKVDRAKLYAWYEKVLSATNAWCVPLDVIDGPEELQDLELASYPFSHDRAAPVWHMNESVDRLLRLVEQDWNRVCIGSAGLYRVVGDDNWAWLMDFVWNRFYQVFGRLPRIHMLRGLKLVGQRWPFYSYDSTDIALHYKGRAEGIAAFAARFSDRKHAVSWQPRLGLLA